MAPPVRSLPAKPESKDGAPPPAAEKATAAEKVSGAGGGSGGGGRGWLPALVVLLIAPCASWGVAQFVLLPKLEKKLTQGAPAEAAAMAGESAANAEKKDPKAGPSAPPTYEFKEIVVNLAGSMGTRYLKTSFIVTGSDPALKSIFESKEAQLKDVTINVLSSLTLTDLEEPGAKNVLREKLVAAYNQALGKKIAEQIYFSDFVIQ